jgi:hypothetical protein
MKRIIKPKDFPIKMNEKNIDVLAQMSLIFPPSIDFNMILPLLTFDEKINIYNRASKIKEEEEKQRCESLTLEEQEEETRKIEDSLKEGPNVFRGNILQQEWDSIDLARIEKEKKDKQ